MDMVSRHSGIVRDFPGEPRVILQEIDLSYYTILVTPSFE